MRCADDLSFVSTAIFCDIIYYCLSKYYCIKNILRGIDTAEFCMHCEGYLPELHLFVAEVNTSQLVRRQ